MAAVEAAAEQVWVRGAQPAGDAPANGGPARQRSGLVGVLDDPERRQYLSDERLPRVGVHERSRKGYGPLRIRAELSERGIAAGFGARWLDDSVIEWAEARDGTSRKVRRRTCCGSARSGQARAVS